MIISKPVLVIVAAVPILVALVIAFPKFAPTGEEQVPSGMPGGELEMRIEFVREDMKRIIFGVTESLGAVRSEVLIINDDGRALYNWEEDGKASQERFQVKMQDLKRLRALIAETGFMYLPKERLDVKEDVTEFTRYTLTVNLGGNRKTVQWVDEPSSKDFVPALLVEIRDRIEGIKRSAGIG